MMMIMNQSNGRKNNYTSVLNKVIDFMDNDDDDTDGEDEDSEEDPEMVRKALKALPIIARMRSE